MTETGAGSYLFISYRSIESDFASKLAKALLHAGYPVWMDRLGGILAGDQWRQSLERGVGDCAAVLACLSRNYVDSTWTRRELQRADSLNKPIFPLLLGPVPDDLWPIEIQDRQYVDFQGCTLDSAYDEALAILLEGIQARLNLAPGPPLAPPRPHEPDPARDDPEDLAERGMTRTGRMEAAEGFAAIEAQELRKDMEVWLKMYKKAAEQNRGLLDDALRVRLEQQMTSYKAEWKRLESRLKDIGY